MADKKNNVSAKEAVLAKIKQYTKHGKVAGRIHEIIMEAAPNLQPRLWYGMPGYAKTKDSAVIVFFREDKYVTFGVTESANMTGLKNKDNKLIAVSWFLEKLDKPTEEKIASIVRAATE